MISIVCAAAAYSKAEQSFNCSTTTKAIGDGSVNPSLTFNLLLCV